MLYWVSILSVKDNMLDILLASKFEIGTEPEDAITLLETPLCIEIDPREDAVEFKAADGTTM